MLTSVTMETWRSNSWSGQNVSAFRWYIAFKSMRCTHFHSKYKCQKLVPVLLTLHIRNGDRMHFFSTSTKFVSNVDLFLLRHFQKEYKCFMTFSSGKKSVKEGTCLLCFVFLSWKNGRIDNLNSFKKISYCQFRSEQKLWSNTSPQNRNESWMRLWERHFDATIASCKWMINEQQSINSPNPSCRKQQTGWQTGRFYGFAVDLFFPDPLSK